MKKKKKKFLIIGVVAILFISSFPMVIGDNPNFDRDELNNDIINKQGSTKTYYNCRIFISGKCNNVIGPLVWLLGFYCPLLKRTFTINAKGQESEVLSVLIIGINPIQLGVFFDYENIYLFIQRANGVLFWGEKSILFKSNSIFVYCKAQSVTVTI